MRSPSHKTHAAESPPLRSVQRVLEWLLLLCPYLFGLFFPWCSVLVSVALSILLFLLLRRGILCLSRSLPFLTAVSVVLLHLGGMLWGIDRGMASVGALQFLPLPLFVLFLEQYTPEDRMQLLSRVPYAASVMVLLSFVLSRFVPLEGWFLVAGRQAGFFQYPNTYALYLLFAVVLVLFGPPLRFGRLPWLAVLVPGILMTGSRTVFVLLLGVLALGLLRPPSRRFRFGLLALTGAAVLGSVLYVLFTGRKDSVGRFLTFSFSSSELLGRLLYVQDALPVILRHPLGLGYTGYLWLQGSFQTGVYSVQHVHNELIQLLLDMGWIPAVLLLVSLWRSFHSPQGGFCRKLLLLVLMLHCLLDFDTQFVAVALLFFLVLDAEPQISQACSGLTGLSSRSVFKAAASLPALQAATLGLLSIFSLWMGAASLCFYLRQPAMALRVYPAYTAALVELLPEASGTQAGILANRVLDLNNSVAYAHDVKANQAFLSGDLPDLIAQKREALRLSRYNLAEYLDYFDLLQRSYERFRQRNDREDADRCLEQLHEIPQMLAEVKAGTSRLGRMISDQPQLDLPANCLSWLNTHPRR